MALTSLCLPGLVLVYLVSSTSALHSDQQQDLAQDTAENKRAPEYFAWGGKRNPEYFAWGGKKRNPEYFSWGGKRAPEYFAWGGKRAPEYFAWGGKRNPEYFAWGGKKRAPEYFAWGGKKRAPEYFAWGGKRNPEYFSWGGKRAPEYFAWGGKRNPEYFAWGGKRSVDKMPVDINAEDNQAVHHSMARLLEQPVGMKTGEDIGIAKQKSSIVSVEDIGEEFNGDVEDSRPVRTPSSLQRLLLRGKESSGP